MWARLPTLALGIWLMAAPAVLGYGGGAATSDRVAGPVIAAVAIVAASAITRGLRWVNLAPGLRLLVAPVLLRFPTPALVNSVLAGLLVLALTPWGRADPDRFGGGWRGLTDPARLAGLDPDGGPPDHSGS